MMRDIVDLKERAREAEARQASPGLADLNSMFAGLPGLRGLWLPGVADNTGAVYDASGQGRTLTYTGNPTINIHDNQVAYYDLDGTGDYLTRADELGVEITGTETYIASGIRGLTLGGWFWADSVTGTPELIAKFGAAPNRAYALTVDGNARAILQISQLGSTIVSVASANASFPISTWHFVVGRFDPTNTKMTIYVDNTPVDNSTGIPTAILGTGSATFNIGADNTSGAGSNVLDGRVALAFLCAAALPDVLINTLFSQTRNLFGV